jgi:hypothetical protein
MTNRERLIAALLALSLAGNAAAQGGPLTPLDDPRLQPVLRGADAGPTDRRYFGDVPSRLAAGGRDAPAVTQPPSVTLKTAGGRSAEENHEPLHHLWTHSPHASPKLLEAAAKGTHLPHATPKLLEAAAKGTHLPHATPKLYEAATPGRLAR